MPNDPIPGAVPLPPRVAPPVSRWPSGRLRCPLTAADSTPHRGIRRLLAAADRAFDNPPRWGEVFSGIGAVTCGVISWWGEVPLQDHPTLGVIARLLGSHIVESVWIAFGAAQIVARLADVWPWRGLMALALTAGWAVPALATIKSDSDAPVLVGACGAWVLVNFAAAVALIRRGPPEPP